jgi:hypothetical protein
MSLRIVDDEQRRAATPELPALRGSGGDRPSASLLLLHDAALASRRCRALPPADRRSERGRLGFSTPC